MHVHNNGACLHVRCLTEGIRYGRCSKLWRRDTAEDKGRAAERRLWVGKRAGSRGAFCSWDGEAWVAWHGMAWHGRRVQAGQAGWQVVSCAVVSLK